MSRILGIDPSLTRTGVGILDHGDPVTARAEVVESTGRRADTIHDRDRRLDAIADEVLAYAVPTTRLVVIEAPSFGSVGGSNWDRAGLWWRLVHRLHGRDLPVAMVAPTTLKKWATGSGRADKSDVAVAMARLWPGVDAASNDGWDGLGLAHIGAQALGWSVPVRAHHPVSVAAVDWSAAPEVGAVPA